MASLCGPDDSNCALTGGKLCDRAAGPYRDVRRRVCTFRPLSSRFKHVTAGDVSHIIDKGTLVEESHTIGQRESLPRASEQASLQVEASS